MEPSPLTDSKTQSYYFAKFSTQCGFYRLSYEGPDIPWQQVRSTASNGEYRESKPEKTILNFPEAVIRALESNPQLALKHASLINANVILSTINVDGFGKLRSWAWLVVGSVIDFVVF